MKFFLILKEIFYNEILFHGVNQLAYKLAIEIFRLSKTFPKEETYPLTDQIRRSSRSVCANIAEAYRKR